MRRIKRISLFLFIGFIAVSVFALFRLIRTPEHFGAPLAAQIEERLGANLSFQEKKIVFTPFPALQIKMPRLQPVTEGFPTLTAEEARFSFQFLPLLWGRAKISGFQLRKGEGIFGGVPLRNVDFKIRGLNSKGTASFEVKASGSKGKEVLRGKGKLSFQDLPGNFWTHLGLAGDFTLKDLALKNFPPSGLSGEWGGRLHLEKEKEKSVLEGQAGFELKNLHSGTSLPFSLTGEAKLLWDSAAHSVEISDVSVKTSFGELEGRGIVNAETGEMGEVRLTAHEVVLEELARHFPNLQSILPTAVGFSGPGEFDVTLQGTWDYLSLHLNVNLTPAVLNYGKIFSKPKDFPMSVNSDFLLKAGSGLSGDFSLRVGQTTIKGAIVGLDLRTGTGELTLLTNKFDLKGWETLLIPFTRYEISGSAKVLWHGKGDLGHLDKVDETLNLTLERATLLSPAGRGIRNVNALMDLSALSLRIKDTSLDLGSSPVKVEVDIYNLSESPQGTVKISSPGLDPFASLENLKMLSPFVVSETRRGTFRKIEEAVQRFFPKPVLLEGFALDLKTQQGKIGLENFDFQALDGSFHFHGETDGPSEKPNFWVEAEFDHVRLAKYFEGIGQPEQILDGNLFFKGKFQAQGMKPQEISESLSGQGTLSITNGDWRSVDLMKAVSSLESFSDLAIFATGSTPFHDLKTSWNFAKGKFDTSDFLLLSDYLWVAGKGNLSTGGTFNSRLEIYLSQPLTAKVLESWGEGERAGEKQLGPFPFLMIGDFKKPEVRADEKSMGSFLEAVRNRRFRKILHVPFRG